MTAGVSEHDCRSALGGRCLTLSLCATNIPVEEKRAKWHLRGRQPFSGIIYEHQKENGHHDHIKTTKRP